MSVQVKMKILHHDKLSNSYEVLCYTDRLVELYAQKVWPEKCKMLVASGHAKTEEEALPKAKEMWPAGSKWSVTDFQKPPRQGADLYKHLIAMSAGDGGWLLHLEKTLSDSPAASKEVGKEFVFTTERDTKGNLVVK